MLKSYLIFLFSVFLLFSCSKKEKIELNTEPTDEESMIAIYEEAVDALKKGDAYYAAKKIYDNKEKTSISYIKLFLQGKYPGAPNFGVLVSDIKDIVKAHVLSLTKPNVGGRRLIVGSEVKKMVEISKIMAEALPEYAKKLPKKELPNFLVKIISHLDTSAKMMVPDLGIQMQTDPSYAENLLGFKFKPAKGCVEDAAKSVVRLGLA